MSRQNRFVCTSCNKVYPLEGRDWRCGCGGLFELETWPRFDSTQIDPGRPGMWRYRHLLPLEEHWEPVTLGEGNTPLLPVEWLGQAAHFKLESMCPTGSFKDRGASALVTALCGMGIERVVDDSLGNAGASLAAYIARAGITCEICVPYAVAGPKLAQMAAYGAEVVEIKGKREYASLAAWAAAAHGAFYASHVYSPFFLAGLRTVAFELWEQLDGCTPAAVFLPVGNGTLLLGVYQGYQSLLEAGQITKMPRLFAVQAAACAPISDAYRAGCESVDPTPPAATVATGIAIAQPARCSQILAAIRATRGDVLRVTEQEIMQAHGLLAENGFWVEETAAAGVAGLASALEAQRIPDGEPVVVLLTGYGLKTSAVAP